MLRHPVEPVRIFDFLPPPLRPRIEDAQRVMRRRLALAPRPTALRVEPLPAFAGTPARVAHALMPFDLLEWRRCEFDLSQRVDPAIVFGLMMAMQSGAEAAALLAQAGSFASVGCPTALRPPVLRIIVALSAHTGRRGGCSLITEGKQMSSIHSNVKSCSVNSSRRSLAGAVVLGASVLALMTGCGAAENGANDEVVSEVGEAIENGTVYPLSSATIMNNVRFERTDGSTLGSGALLRNDWVLTAAHLFPADRIANPSGTMSVRLGNELLKASEVYIAPGLDVALVRMSTGFLINSSRTGFVRPLHSGTPASLVGQTLDCWGFGANDPSGAGAGTLRRAAQKVVESASGWVGIERNSAGQLMTTGDSGGVCFFAGQAIGVHNSRYHQVNGVYMRGHETHAASFRTWASGIIDRKPVTLHRSAVTCAGASQGAEQVISLTSGYSNYTCKSRFQQQCIDDRSFDSFYMEWCDYAAPTCRASGPKSYICDPGATPTGTCRASRLHRTQVSCDGKTASPEQIIDLSTGYSNFTCGNRFRAQCIDDGSFDAYYSESCDYTCN